MRRRLMPPEETTRLLREILRRANARGLRGNIRVVGGAAIAIMDPHRRTTSDIDAVLLPQGALDDIVSELAAEHDLQEGWLTNPPTRPDIPSRSLVHDARKCHSRAELRSDIEHHHILVH